MSGFDYLSSERKGELWATFALRHCKGIGASRAKLLVDAFGSPFRAVDACLRDNMAWTCLGGSVPRSSIRYFVAEGWRDNAKIEWDLIKKSKCDFLLWSDPLYPDRLRNLPDAPLILYYKGDISLLESPAVGVVGSRSCTKEGVRVAAFFAQGLSQAGVVVISGMAKGIDRAAHLGGLECIGKSIAVLGTGVDVIYPACNADLAHKLGYTGLILSEFAPKTPPAPNHFPIRNRLISGLSHGVLVVEAAGRSGSLITARLALEQGKDVFAVPGHTMASVSEGCRELIRQGAKAVFSADDILLELAPQLSLEVQSKLKSRTENLTTKPIVPCVETITEEEELFPYSELPWIAPEFDKKGKRRITKKKVEKQADISLSIPPKKATFQQSAQKVEGLSIDEQQVFSALEKTPQHIDALSRKLVMNVAALSSILLQLEIKGLITKRPGMFYLLPDSL